MLKHVLKQPVYAGFFCSVKRIKFITHNNISNWLPGVPVTQFKGSNSRKSQLATQNGRKTTANILPPADAVDFAESGRSTANAVGVGRSLSCSTHFTWLQDTHEGKDCWLEVCV